MNFKVKTIMNALNGEILQKTESEIDGFATKTYITILKTQEEGIRQALIKLGWTPPSEKQVLTPTVFENSPEWHKLHKIQNGQFNFGSIIERVRRFTKKEHV